MKGKYFIIFFVLAVSAFCLVRIIYPILNISSVYPPMNEYDFSFNTNELTDKINKLDKGEDNLDFKITDTTGTSRQGKRIKKEVELFTMQCWR